MGFKDWLNGLLNPKPTEDPKPAKVKEPAPTKIAPPPAAPPPQPQPIAPSDPAPLIPGRTDLPNRALFYAQVRKEYGGLKQSQVDGFEHIFERWDKDGYDDDPYSDFKLSYALATTWHETAYTMQPIIEMGGTKYLKSKPYYPWYGRGFVQLTWKVNYKRYGIADRPERALEPDLSAHILLDGMTKGIFTGRKLADFFNAKGQDPVNARRIINGIDKAQAIAKHYQVFLTGLKAVTAADQKLT